MDANPNCCRRWKDEECLLYADLMSSNQIFIFLDMIVKEWKYSASCVAVFKEGLCFYAECNSVHVLEL